MSLSFIRRVLIWTPASSSTCVRTMKSINTRHLKPMHLQRAKILHFTKPIRPKERRSMAERCTINDAKLEAEKRKSTELTPVEVWASNRVKQCFLSSQLVAVFHMEGFKEESRKKLRRRLQESDMQLKFFNNKICKAAVAGTKLENMAPLFVDSNVFIVGEEPLVKEMLKLTKKVNRIHLLGGFVIDRLMTAEEMRTYAQLPPLPMLQGQLVGILSAASSRTYQLLQANQQRLSSNLSQLVKQTVDKDDEAKKS